jgi:hypothetical protein
MRTMKHGGVVAMAEEMAEREVVRYASRSFGARTLLSFERCVEELWEQFTRRHFAAHEIPAVRCVLRKLLTAHERKERVKRRRLIGRERLVDARYSPAACMGSNNHLRGEASEWCSKSPERGSRLKGASAHTRGWRGSGG